MMFSANNDKSRNDTNNGSSSSSTSDEYLLSLLRQPSLDAPAVSSSLDSSSYYLHPPLSFEDPFDDPRMEPLAFRECDLSDDQAGIASESTFTRTDSLALSFVTELGELAKEEAKPNKHRQEMIDSPAIDHARVSSESIFTREDIFVLPFLAEPGKSTKEEPGNRQNMIDVSNPMTGPVGSKRSSMDALTSQDNGPGNAKRQRANPVQETNTNSEEYRSRFRPTQEKQWQAQFQKLIEFKHRSGHCRVPHDFPEDQVLSRWVKRQRYQYKKLQDKNPTSTITTSRIKQLESIGFIWNSHTTAWQDKFDELKVFKQRTGHCNVPSSFLENEALASWVLCQRRQYRRYISGRSSNLTKGRFEALKALGFVFDPQAAKTKEV